MFKTEYNLSLWYQVVAIDYKGLLNGVLMLPLFTKGCPLQS